MKDSGEGDETAWETPPTSMRIPREGEGGKGGDERKKEGPGWHCRSSEI